MKYLVMGHSGSGKSSLAKLISDSYNIPLMYLDCVHFSSNWNSRSDEEAISMLNKFMNDNDSWVVDGNYFRFILEERLQKADKVVILLFNRFSCLVRAYKRYFKYKGKIRESIAPGCYETMDLEFIKWILFEGRTKKRMKVFNEIINNNKDKVVVIRNQKELDKFIEKECKIKEENK